MKPAEGARISNEEGSYIMGAAGRTFPAGHEAVTHRRKISIAVKTHDHGSNFCDLFHRGNDLRPAVRLEGLLSFS